MEGGFDFDIEVREKFTSDEKASKFGFKVEEGVAIDNLKLF